MLRWSPPAFWASNVREVSLAWDGYAESKGITKRFDPRHYPDDAGRRALRERVERERGDT